MKTKLSLLCLSLVLAVAGLAACDKASPVAPAGTVLSVTANPTQISATGSSQVRVVALRSNGTPVNPGTQIRLSTNLGTVEPLVEVGDDGIAVGTLRGDGRFGTATVTASVGAETTATVEVQIGRAAASASVQATPPSVPDTGGTVTLLALVRDVSGQPLPGATVNFTTEVGTLASGGGFRVTDASGQATDRLTVSESDINSLPLGTNAFTVGVEVGGEAAVVSATFEVRLETAPLEADFTASVTGLTVRFTDLSIGEPTQWLWSFGDGTTSREQNPTHTYSAGATYPVTLQVTRGRNNSQITKQVTVSSP
jgi:PKD repeat protein